jgi:hypothetical protein
MGTAEELGLMTANRLNRVGGVRVIGAMDEVARHGRHVARACHLGKLPGEGERQSAWLRHLLFLWGSR